jgi:hypothetical protein
MIATTNDGCHSLANTDRSANDCLLSGSLNWALIPMQRRSGKPRTADIDVCNKREPWERTALVKMSEGYCSARLQSKDVFAIAPIEQL